MSYKTILVQADDSSNATQRIQAAVKLALKEDARLIGVANTGIARLLHDTLAIFPDRDNLAPYLPMMKERATTALTDFENIARSLGVTTIETRLLNGEKDTGISVRARYADLVIHGQYDPDDPWWRLTSELPEYVAMNSGTPVLVIPRTGGLDTLGERVLIGWNNSLQAARAVHDAIPLLTRATSVHVALFRSTAQSTEIGAAMSADIGAYLASQGIQADVMQKECNEITEGGMGMLLLKAAAELQADLLVMGCYGRWRVREILLGGASRTVLDATTIPVFLAH